MQSIKVNLLPYKQRWFTLRRRLAWWLTTGSMIGALGYAVVLVAIVTWQLTTGRQLQATVGRIDQNKKEAEAWTARESQLVLVKTKLAKVIELTGQPGMTPALRAIGSLLVPGVAWREMAVKADGSIEVTLAGSDVVAIGDILDQVEALPGSGDFSQVRLTSLTKASNGEYALTLNLSR
jgi:Tfp pilus assembly protein PilN